MSQTHPSNPLLRLFKPGKADARPVPATEEAVAESPYARYLQDRFNPAEARTLTPTSRDVFLLSADVQHVADTVGLFHAPKNLLLVRDPCKGETGRMLRLRMEPDSIPLFGNWRGYGKDGYACYNPARSLFSLWFQVDQTRPDSRFSYGLPGRGWLPLTGDWDGDGKDGIGLYDPSTGYFFLRNSLSAGLPDYYFRLQQTPTRAIPLAGDWNGDGISGVGLYQPETGLFYLSDTLDAVVPAMQFSVEPRETDAIALAGDWNGTGSDRPGLYLPRQSRFLLWLQTGQPHSDTAFRFSHKGLRGTPVSLRWAL